MELHVRELMKYSMDDVIELPEYITLIFDDDSRLDTHIRRVAYYYHFLELFRHYPNTPILQKHSLEAVLKGKPLTSSTHIKLLEIIYKDIVAFYNLEYPGDREFLWDLIYIVTNNLYNDITQFAEPYVASIDVLDFTQIVSYDKVIQSKAKVTESEASISICYDEITDILKHDPYLDNNSVAEAVRAEMVNLGQVLQCVAIRGRVTEVDGAILPFVILDNYTVGLNQFHYYAGESRIAAKALYFSDAKLQDAEYFARRIQILCMIVKQVDYIDCGSQKTIDWRIIPPSYDEEGNKTYLGDLAFMEGKYYYDDNNELKVITHDDPELYNKTLRLRTVLYCQHPDPHQVCEVCFGRLSKNISVHQNLGHLCAATMTQQTTQSVLSTKHLDRSSSGSTIVLNDVSAKYFETDKGGMLYYVNHALKSQKVRLVLTLDAAIGLIDILNIDNLDSLNPVRISSIECIEILTRVGNVETAMIVYLSQGNKRVMMTTEFLKYLKQHRWSTDSKNNFVFDLEYWDFSKPIFKLPEVEYSYSDHSKMIAKIIESNMTHIADREEPFSPVSTLQELFSLVNTKINVNIATLEVIVYATMIKAPGQYALGRNVEDPVLGVADQVIKNRSLGAALSYEDTAREMINPKNFFMLDRQDSVFDVFITPQEYIEANPND